MLLKCSLLGYVKQALKITAKKVCSTSEDTLKWFVFADKERKFNGIETSNHILVKLLSDTINMSVWRLTFLLNVKNTEPLLRFNIPTPKLLPTLLVFVVT